MEMSGELPVPAALLPGMEPLVPLDRRLDGPQNRSGRGGEEKNSQPLSGLEPTVFQPVSQRCTTELSRLLYVKCRNDTLAWSEQEARQLCESSGGVRLTRVVGYFSWPRRQQRNSDPSRVHSNPRQWPFIGYKVHIQTLNDYCPTYWHVKFPSMVCGSLSPRHGASSGRGWTRRPRNLEGSHEYSDQPIRTGPPAWGLGKGLTSPHLKRMACYDILHKALVSDSYKHGNEPSDY
jgi:hypothetical protein